ncbi:DUF6069 family protein [Cellulomonas edaphi]|uniref:DUF6069 family protein n=1 Tax=Cellulomonas edaphi TaxID=3053468 RepID=A0ABT7S2X8_9CELL|nr:DUF6069 family protein [Cellulomons edaphi]MDM7829970.1 DUF6069 family protein [Cellulomons edaphi]
MPTTPAPFRRVPVAAVVLAAVVVALAVWLIAVPAAGVTAEVEAADGTTSAVGPAPVAAVAALAVLLAWPVRAACARARKGPAVLAWRLTCGTVLLVSLVGPLGATTASGTLLLAVLHVAVAVVVVVGLDPRRSPRARVRQ